MGGGEHGCAGLADRGRGGKGRKGGKGGEGLGLLLGRKPFEPSYLTFLPTERYYAAQVFFLPLFGLAVWLLMSGVVHVVLRLAAHESDFDQVLNIVGMGMLVPMPVVWLWDWSMILSNSFQMAVMAVSHSIFQLWEAWVEAIGLRRVLGLRALPAAGLALLANVLFVLLAMTFVR